MKSKLMRLTTLLLAVSFILGLSVKAPSMADDTQTDTTDKSGPVILIDGMTPEEYANKNKIPEGTGFRAVGNTGMGTQVFGMTVPPMTIDGEIAYCLNYEKGFPTNSNYSAGSPYNDPAIKAALYHGYPVNASSLMGKYGLNDTQARQYTQIAIWDYMDTKTGANQLADKRASHGYIKELRDKMDAGDISIKQFSVSSRQLQLTEQNDGSYLSQKITTTGAKGTFTVKTKSNNNIQVLNANNNSPITGAVDIGTPIKVKVPSGVTGTINVSFDTSLKKPASLKYDPTGNGSLQSMCKFSWGDPLDHQTSLAGNVAPKGEIKIVKKDSVSKKVLAGAVFDVINKATGKSVGTIKTNDKGEGSLKNLSYGTYTIKEKTAPAGYELSTKAGEVKIDANNKVVTYNAENAPKRSKVKIIKKDATTGKLLEGATFQLKKQGSDSITTLTTKADGSITSQELYPGTYEVKEVTAPKGYVLSDKSTQTVKITGDQDVVSVEFKNKKITGNVDLLKIDSRTKKPIQGATFSVYKKGETKALKSVNTDAKGVAKFTALEYGEYEFKETKAPTGYVKTAETVAVNITENGKTYEETITNDLIQGKLKIIKTDGETKQLLEGAVFGIYNKATGKLVTKVTTNAKGEAITGDLDYGTYQVKELQAPKGYYLNEKTWDLTINQDAKIYECNVGNDVVKAKIKIIKRDRATDVPLAGVTFKIQDSEGKDVVFTGKDEKGNAITQTEFTTDENGEVTTLDYLYAGDYTLVEVKHSPRYLDIEPIPFTISDTEVYPVIDEVHSKVLEVYNDEITGKVVLNKYFVPTEIDNVLQPYTTPEKLWELRQLEISLDNSLGGEGNTTLSYTMDEEGKVDVETITNGDSFTLTKTFFADGTSSSGLNYLPGQAKKHVLENAEFDLYELKGDVLWSEMTEKEQADAEWELVGTYLTNNDGQIVFDTLGWGSYKFVETGVPANFIETEDTYFEITKPGEEIALDVVNEVKTGEVEITKYDVHDGTLLPGAHFQILNEDKEVILEGVTDENGIFKFKLEVGKYYYKETQAPTLNGTEYVLDEGEYPFEIKENGEIVKCKAPNKNREAPDTNASVGIGGVGIGLSAMIASGVIYLQRKRNR